MIINTHPADRRRMIHELSNLLSTPAEYLRSPTYGYRIGHLVVNRDGTISTESPHMVEVIRPFLLEHHYLIEETPAATQAPLPAPVMRRALHISANIASVTAYQLRQLLLILYCRQYILNRMLKTNDIFIDYEFARELECEVPDTTTDMIQHFTTALAQGKINGLSLQNGHITLEIQMTNQDPDHIPVYKDLLKQLISMAAMIKSIRLYQHVPDSEKYTARAFLIRLGYLDIFHHRTISTNAYT